MPSPTATPIDCRRLQVVFADGTRALRGVDLQVAAGEIVAVVGASGCGKSTLLRAIAGLQPPTSGCVRRGEAAAARPGDLSYVFQEAALLPWRDAMENVLLPLELLSIGSREERRARARTQLERVGLEAEALRRRPHQLSGGMRMRVSIARALVTDPSILLLDEPFAALDDMLRNRLGQLVLQLWSEQQPTIVLVTHNIGEAVLMSHRVLVMGNGTIDDEVPITLPAQRSDALRGSPEFARLYGEVADRLRHGAVLSEGG